MSITQDLRTRAKHRGKTPWQLVKTIGRLEREADEQTCQIVELATQVDALTTDRNRLATQLDEQAVAHAAVVDNLTTVCDELRGQLAALCDRFGPQLAEEANANRIDVPPMMPIGADQDTEPIDVRPLWAAADAGLLGPVLDPGHVPDLGDTQPIPTA